MKAGGSSRAVLVAFLLSGLAVVAADASDKVVSRAECEAVAARVVSKLPPGWRVADSQLGAQKITMHWGEKPMGLRVRLEGPEYWKLYIYKGPPMTPAKRREYFRNRPEYIDLWIVPRSYRPEKDIFVADWFRPDRGQTHRLGTEGLLDVYAFGERCFSWPRWKSDLKRNLRRGAAAIQP